VTPADETDPGEDERPVGAAWIDGFIQMLDQHGTGMIPRPVELSEADSAALAAARTRAIDQLAALAWAPLMPELRRRLAEWFLVRFQRAQFRAMYFGGWSSRPADRVQGFEALEDAALAILLHDHLDPETYDRLVARSELGTGVKWLRPTPR
jgi:hypothetical protein